MPLLLLNLGLLVVIGAGAWWLTGLDRTDGGESRRGHYFTRALRCGAVLALTEVFLWLIESPGLDYGGIPVLIIIPTCMALVLRSSLSEVFAHGVLGLLDPQLHDRRAFDPKKAQRYQDAIAHLINHGKREEAIKLCEELKESGEVDVVTLDHTLEFLGVAQAKSPRPPLVEADRLRTAGDFKAAEALLRSVLMKHPADAGAALMLMRVYAQDWHAPERAKAVLARLEKEPQVSGDLLTFARASLEEWSRPQPPPLPAPAAEPAVQSLDELLEQGSFGTAVARLEDQLRTEPANFELRLKLAEVHAVYCHNPAKAEKIVQQMERDHRASPEQVARAKAKLAAWCG